MGATAPRATRSQVIGYGAAIFIAVAAASALFAFADTAYVRFVDARFPRVGTSTWLATLWGIVSRAHILLLVLPFAIWRPRALGLALGETRRRWLMLTLMAVANCGVMAIYLWVTARATPYSGNQWLLTEVVTVPFVEEIMWRGLVFAAVLAAARRVYSDRASAHITAWLTGLAFGLMHAKNMVTGVPISFAALQALNASIWGVVYGYARARTGSVFPPMLLHAAMNLVVVLLS